jgi:glycosyltransferase involved in cell wall biosynthesis
MKIAWVTPLARRSAIGRVSAAIVKALYERGHEITLIRAERDRTDADSIHPISVSVPILWWHDLSPTDIELQNDAVVLNVGDNYIFHAGTLALVDRALCVGIFHDFYLYNLFNRWLAYQGLGEDVHEREVRCTYGEQACQLAGRAWRGTAPVEELAEIMPMTEWLASRCGAALAHSRFYSDLLKNSCPGPVAVAPLCYEPRDISALCRRHDDPVTIAVLGVINPNKCVDAVIRSIASSAMLRARCRLRLVGAIDNTERNRLEQLCNETGLTEVTILGEVDDAVWVKELEAADILSCLRKPVLEGASASAIEGMKAGRPIVIADAGFYSDLPDDLVFKIPAEVNVSTLTKVLERLVEDENLRRETAAKAQRWAFHTFTTDAYVTILEDLLRNFVNAKPLLVAGKRIAQQLAILGVSPGDPSVKQLATKLELLFSPSETRSPTTTESRRH